MTTPDIRTLPRNDQALLGLGLLAFIVSFFPYYGWNHGFGSVNAWHQWALVGMLLILASTIVAAIQVFSTQTLPRLAVSWNVLVAGLSVLGAICIVIRSLTLPSGTFFGASIGLRWGGWLLIIVAILHAIVAVLRLRASGEPMPWAARGAPPPPPAV